jgi:hypothetical protein
MANGLRYQVSAFLFPPTPIWAFSRLSNYVFSIPASTSTPLIVFRN